MKAFGDVKAVAIGDSDGDCDGDCDSDCDGDGVCNCDGVCDCDGDGDGDGDGESDTDGEDAVPAAVNRDPGGTDGDSDGDADDELGEVGIRDWDAAGEEAAHGVVNVCTMVYGASCH